MKLYQLKIRKKKVLSFLHFALSGHVLRHEHHSYVLPWKHSSLELQSSQAYTNTVTTKHHSFNPFWNSAIMGLQSIPAPPNTQTLSGNWGIYLTCAIFTCFQAYITLPWIHKYSNLIIFYQQCETMFRYLLKLQETARNDWRCVERN